MNGEVNAWPQAGGDGVTKIRKEQNIPPMSFIIQELFGRPRLDSAKIFPTLRKTCLPAGREVDEWDKGISSLGAN
jgi:hypothetical protein